MIKKKGKEWLKRALCLTLSAAVLFTALPLELLAAPKAAEETSENVLELQNDYVSIHMSKENGGFYIGSVEGDKTIKSDNNKDLLYHNEDYDTSFTSFRITKNGTTKDYIFGGDYSYEGIAKSEVVTSKDEKGMTAVWTLGELTFTQRLELANTGSNEHGMVMVSYQVKNNSKENVQIEARILMDSAIGDQDYVHYELPDTSYASDIIEQEYVVDAEDVPTVFYAYDDLYDPTATASTVISSKGMLKKIAFAHWNSLAATDFDFAPNETLNFTKEGNVEYGTADSAMAMYYDLGIINKGQTGLVNTYYGIYSNEKTDLNKDTVTFHMAAPSVLELSADKKHYLSNCNRKENGSFQEDGIFHIQASLKNISGKINYDKIVVAVYASEGITPLDEFQKELDYETSYAEPYQSTYVDFTDGTEIKIPFYFKAEVDSAATYRKITFRVYNLPDSTDTNLLNENMLYETSTYVLCPGGSGELPKITFSSASPQILYNELTRHLYVSGNNFSMLEDKSRYTLYAQGASDKKKYEIPAENIGIDPEENKLDILFTENMKPDTYTLSFEWTEPPTGIDKVLTASALKVVMSDDIFYRNDYYGILAVVQEKGKTESKAKYQIKSYKNESEYEKDKANYEEILLFFQGTFIKDDTFAAGNSGTNARYVAKSISGEKDKIVINGTMDAFDGTVTVTQEDGEINTDFDEITLNASVENTRIYKGNAAFTTIADGAEYSLVPYNMNGEEIPGFYDEEITLIYPAALNGLMTIAGMAFNLSFARLGMMYDSDAENMAGLKSEEAQGFLMSFSAQLDLSFLIPVSRRNKTGKKTDPGQKQVFADDKAKAEYLREQYQKTYTQKKGSSGSLSNNNNKNNNTGNNNGNNNGGNNNGGNNTGGNNTGGNNKKYYDEDKGETAASVEVQNVLYGMNQGFIGVNFSVEIGIPGYTDSMPNIYGTLDVNTVNDWSFGVEGKASFLKTLTLEARIGIKSKYNIPIVDDLYLYVQGVKPGINIDTVGVCWLLGGGGGFEDFYDSIFCSSEVPPIKLLLSVSFGLFEVLEARADMYLGLTGFGIKISNLCVSETDIEFMDYANLEMQWIPAFKMLMQCHINFMDVIDGKGYIVIDQAEESTEAFEAYAIASVKVPDTIPLIGGIEVGNASLGLNTTRIWGALKVIGISTGISYAYGGDLSFGSEAEVKPTYPQYLEEARNTNGISGAWYAVGYDEEKQDMLYMNIGSNITERTANSDLAAEGDLVSSLQSDITKTYHNFHLGTYEEGAAVMLSIAFTADSLEKAKEVKENLQIEKEDGEAYVMQYYANEKSEEENEAANANFTYDAEKKEGTIVLTFTDASAYDQSYTVRTAASSELILYDVASLPEITSVNLDTETEYSNTKNTLELTWAGNDKMSNLESLDIYILENPDSDTEGGTPIVSLKGEAVAEGKATIKLPETLESGSYYVRLVYSQEEVTNGILDSFEPFVYTNSEQPAELTNVAAENVGDLHIRASVPENKDEKCQGVMFKVYEINENGEKVEKEDYSVTATKNEAGEIYAILGGSAQVKTTDEKGKESVEIQGLTAGKKYVIGAIPFNTLTDSEENMTGLVYGEEIYSEELVLNTPEEVTITLRADKEKQEVSRMEYRKAEDETVSEEEVIYDTYTDSNLLFTAQSDHKITGTWVLDSEEGKTGTYDGSTDIPVELTDLEDGDHTLQFYGSNEQGDGFSQTFTFVVDTTAPTLLLNSPTNGSGFAKDGTLTFSGITDTNAYLTILVDGEPAARKQTLEDLGAVISEENEFSFDLNIGSGYYKKEIVISASDEVGNTQTISCSVYNDGMGEVKDLDIALSADTTETTEKEWVSYTNKNLFLRDAQGLAVALQVCAVTEEDEKIILNDLDTVDLEVRAVSGTASIENGTLSVSEGGHGFVQGKWNLTDGAALTASFTYGAEVLGQLEEAEGYTVTYLSNGGEGIMTDPNSPYEKYATVQAANCSFTKEGMEFVCWNTKADGSGTTYQSGDKFYITENMELYAIWKKSVQKPEIPDTKPTKPNQPTPNVPQNVIIGRTYPVGNAKYKVTSATTVTFVGTTAKKAKKLNVPAEVTINGKRLKVTAIGSAVCKGNTKLKSVTIGKNVKTIAAKAFFKNKNLKKIKIQSSVLTKIGKNAFKGIHKKAVFTVPKKAKKKYKKKFTAKVGFAKKTMKLK